MNERTKGILIGILSVIAVAGCAGLVRVAVQVWEALGALAKYG